MNGCAYSSGMMQVGNMYRLYNEDDPNLNCITGLYQNAEAFLFPIASSRSVQCN